jgi:hypothetical protein
MSDGIIGSIGVAVTPDARDFWTRFQEQTRTGASEAGRSAGRGVMDGIRSETDRGVDVRVNADTARARAEIAALRSQLNNMSTESSRTAETSQRASANVSVLRDAIIGLGPALVPIAGVASGAILGLVPATAAAILGIKGISDASKQGLLAPKYVADLKQMQTEFTTLKQTAAGGLLPGLDRALSSSAPLFKAVNGEVAVMSTQLGNIVAGAAPGLLRIFTQLTPLFTTFGNELAKGAAHFEHWAATSNGVSKFVGYVQQELPTVEHALEQLIELAGKLIAGLAPMGHVVLSGIGMLASALNAIPLDVLSKLETGALAAYAAFRTYQTITPLVASVTNAIEGLQARQAEQALAAQAGALQTEAAAAEQAAVFAESQAVEARAAAAAVEQIAASTASLQLNLASGAAAAVTAAAQFATAQEEQAVAARASATSIAESAAAAQAASEEQAASSVGFSAALGPIAALAVGVGILGMAFLSNGDQAKIAAQSQQAFADSVKQSTVATSAANQAQALKTLNDQNALVALDQLHAKNILLATSSNDLVQAITGPLSKAKQVINDINAEIDKNPNGDSGTAKQLHAVGDAVYNLRNGLSDEIKAQILYNEAQKAMAEAADGGAAAAGRQAGALGVSTQAYLDAQVATKKNADATAQQTVQFQLANDAGSLLAQTLDRLSGKNLSYAQAQNAFEQQLVSMVKNTNKGGDAINGLSSAAIKNRGNLIQLVQGAEQAAEAYGKLTGHSSDARQKLIDLRKQIIDNAVANGENRKQVTAFIDSLLKIPKKGQVPATHLDVNKKHADEQIAKLEQDIAHIRQSKPTPLLTLPDAAKQQIADLQVRIDAIRQHTAPAINVAADNAMTQIAKVQYAIDSLRNGSITLTTYVQQVIEPTLHGAGSSSQTHDSHHAAGGYIIGPGTGTSDSIPARLSNGEYVINAKQTAKHRALLEQINKGVAGFAAGGIVTLSPTLGGSSSGGSSGGSGRRRRKSGGGRSSSGRSSSSSVGYVVDGKQYGSLRSADNAALTKYRAELALDVKVDSKDLPAFQKALKGTVDQVNTAFATLRADAVKAGVGSAFLKTVDRLHRETDGLINQRTRIENALGTPPKTATTAYDRLATAIANVKAEHDAVKGAITGSFDISTAGADPVTGKVTGAGIVAQAKQDEERVKKFVADATKLKGKINNAYWGELVGKGPDALPQVDALLSLPKASLQELNQAQAGINSAGNQLGNTAGQQLYGAQEKAAQQYVNRLIRQENSVQSQINNHFKRIEKQFTHAVDVVSHRPINVYADGKIIARVVNEQNKKAARR